MVYLDTHSQKVSKKIVNGELGAPMVLRPKYILAIYIRVSPKGTGKHDKEEMSLNGQKKDLLSLIEKNSWGFYNIYEETVSGSVAFENRSEGKRLLEDAAKGKFNVVIIWDSDRLGRDMEGLAAKMFRSKMRQFGVQVYSLHQPHQLKDPEEYIENPYDEGQILQETIHDWQSASTITKFRRRSMKGRLERVKRGKMINTPPYGLKLEPLKDKKGQIVIRKDGRVVYVRVVCEEEVVIVIRTYREYVYEGKSMNEIRDGLNRDGIPTKKGRSWERAMVGRILTNPVYYGALVYNKHFRRKDPLTGETKWGKNPKEKWIVVSPKITEHPPIIKKKLFDKAQRVREAKLRVGAVAVHSDFLFSGLGKCGICGNTLYRTKVRSKYKRKSDGKVTKYQSNGYVCGRWRRFRDTERVYVSERVLKDAILSDLKRFKDNPQALEGFIEESKQKDLNQTGRTFELKKKALSQVDKRFNRLLKAYELSHLSLDKFNTATERLSEEEKLLKSEVKTLEKELGDKTKREMGKKDFMEAVEKFEDVFENGDIKTQKRFLRSLVKNVVVGKEKIKINYLLGGK